MERIQVTRRISSGPIVLLMAFLAMLALGVTGWYVVSSLAPSHNPASTVAGYPGPDARDRDAQLREQLDPNATHGR